MTQTIANTDTPHKTVATATGANDDDADVAKKTTTDLSRNSSLSTKSTLGLAKDSAHNTSASSSTTSTPESNKSSASSTTPNAADMAASSSNHNSSAYPYSDGGAMSDTTTTTTENNEHDVNMINSLHLCAANVRR